MTTDEQHNRALALIRAMYVTFGERTSRLDNSLRWEASVPPTVHHAWRTEAAELGAIDQGGNA